MNRTFVNAFTGSHITPGQVVDGLDQIGIKISRNTLLRWERSGVVSEPERGSYGRGQGRYSHYPKSVIAEAAAAWALLRAPGVRMTLASIAQIRKVAMGRLEIEKAGVLSGFVASWRSEYQRHLRLLR